MKRLFRQTMPRLLIFAGIMPGAGGFGGNRPSFFGASGASVFKSSWWSIPLLICVTLGLPGWSVPAVAQSLFPEPVEVKSAHAQMLARGVARSRGGGAVPNLVDLEGERNIAVPHGNDPAWVRAKCDELGRLAVAKKDWVGAAWLQGMGVVARARRYAGPRPLEFETKLSLNRLPLDKQVLLGVRLEDEATAWEQMLRWSDRPMSRQAAAFTAYSIGRESAQPKRAALYAMAGALSARLGIPERAIYYLSAAEVTPGCTPRTRAIVHLWRAHLAVANGATVEAGQEFQKALAAAGSGGDLRLQLDLCQKALFDLGWDTRSPAMVAGVAQAAVQAAQRLPDATSSTRLQAQMWERFGVFAWNQGWSAVAQEKWKVALPLAQRSGAGTLVFWLEHHLAIGAASNGLPDSLKEAAQHAQSAYQQAETLKNNRLLARALLLSSQLLAVAPDKARLGLANARTISRSLPVRDADLEVEIALTQARAARFLKDVPAEHAAVQEALALQASPPLRQVAREVAAIAGMVEPESRRDSYGLPSKSVGLPSLLPELTSNGAVGPEGIQARRALERSNGEAAFGAIEASRAALKRTALETMAINPAQGLSDYERARDTEWRRLWWLGSRRQFIQGLENVSLTPLVYQLAQLQQRLRVWQQGLGPGATQVATARGNRWLTARDVASRLPGDVALVVYFYDGRGLSAVAAAKTSSGVQWRCLPFQSAGEIGQKVQIMKNAIGSLRDIQPPANDLYGKILGPLESVIGGKKRLWISPDGPLWSIPFQALVKNDGRFVLDSHEVRLADCGSTLLENIPGPDLSKTVLAVANPVYADDSGGGNAQDGGKPIGADGRAVNFNDPEFALLSAPWSGARAIEAESRALIADGRSLTLEGLALAPLGELNALEAEDGVRASGGSKAVTGGVMPATGGARSGGPSLVKTRFLGETGQGLLEAAIGKALRLLRDNEAGERQVREAMGGQNLGALHFAAQTYLLPQSPFSSGIGLTVPHAGRSAAALEDGFLSAAELYDVKTNCGVVALPFANTAGAGKDGGMAIKAMSWGWREAGCKSLVLGQWTALPAATNALSANFYFHARGDANTARALQKAMMDLRSQSKFAHPFYWARMMAVG